MRKWMIVGLIILLLGVAAFVAVLNVNSFVKRNKDYLLDQAQQALQRKVTVGDVEATIFGGIGVRLADFALSDDPAYSKDDFVRAKDLQINLKFWPLLRGEFQVKRLILHDPVIHILRNAKGDFNFSTIGKKDKQEVKEKQQEKTEPAPKKPSSGFVLALADISGGELRYQDLKEGTDIALQQIDLTLEDLDTARPFPVTLACALFAAKQNVNLKATVGPVPADGNFSQLPLDGQLQSDGIDVGKLTAAVPQIKSSLPKDANLSGILKIKELKFKGTLPNFALKGGIDGTDADVRFGKSFHKAPGIPLTISTDAQYANSAILLRQGEIKLHTMELASKGEIKLGDGARVDLTLDSKPVSLEGWEKIIPAIENYQLSGKTDVHATLRGKTTGGASPQVEGVMKLTGVSAKPPQFPKAVKDLDATINFTGQKADIKETTLRLGNSRIRLAAVVDKFSPLTLSYKMSTPEVRPADFQAELPEERKSDVIKDLASDGQLALRDGSVMFQGKMSSGQGTLYKIGYKSLDATVSLANKIATIRNLRANALGGALLADGEYAFNNPVPRFSLASKVQGVDIKELYGALSPKAAYDIRGRLNADMKITGTGQKWEEIQPALRGQGEAEVLQGALLNFNIADGVMSGITGIPGMANMINPRLRSKYPATFEAKDTEFKEMKGQFDLADGRMNVKNLRIVAADYSTQGSGWVDFDRKVDFRSVLLFSQQMSADIGQSAREVKYLFNNQNQLEIPFALTGRLPNVKPKPDASYLGKMVQRGLLEKGTEELQRRFFGNKESKAPEESPPADSKQRKKGSTEDLIRKGLDGLFKR